MTGGILDEGCHLERLHRKYGVNSTLKVTHIGGGGGGA